MDTLAVLSWLCAGVFFITAALSAEAAGRFKEKNAETCLGKAVLYGIMAIVTGISAAIFAAEFIINSTLP